MAIWCLNTGQTPTTWRHLTRLERDAFTAVARQRYRKRS